MNILDKIRNLPEARRKIIFWLILIIIGLGLAFVYFINIRNNIRNFKSVNLKEGFKIPNFGEELKDYPKPEIPKLNEEDVKQMEEDLKKLEESQRNEEENQTSTLENQATTTQ